MRLTECVWSLSLCYKGHPHLVSWCPQSFRNQALPAPTSLGKKTPRPEHSQNPIIDVWLKERGDPRGCCGQEGGRPLWELKGLQANPTTEW